MQTLKDHVEFDGTKPLQIQGRGLVVGLNGQGDTPKGPVVAMIKAWLQKQDQENRIPEEVNSRNYALVIVTAELAPFQRKGTKIDVRVSALGDAKSLQDGTLLPTLLQSTVAGTQGLTPWVQAAGPVTINGDIKTGNPVVGSALGGGVILRHYDQKLELVKWRQERAEELELIPHTQRGGTVILEVRKTGRQFLKNRPFVRLNLRQPDPSLSSKLATQISEFIRDLMKDKEDRSGLARRPALALDSGSIEVLIPTREEFLLAAKLYNDGTKRDEVTRPYEEWEADPMSFIERLMEMPVTIDLAQRAQVVINDATKTVTVTGAVTVRPGIVRLMGRTGVMKVKIDQSVQTLTQLLDDERIIGALTPAQVVELVKELHKANLIQAEVVIR